MKNKITIKKSNNYIHFYLHCDAGQAYLFSEKFHKGVYDYFRNGRSEGELREYRAYNEYYGVAAASPVWREPPVRTNGATPFIYLACAGSSPYTSLIERSLAGSMLSISILYES